MLFRLILLIVICALGYSLYKKLQKGKAEPKETPPPPAIPTEMKRCAKCGVHMPIQDSIQYQTLYFCCEDHKKAYLLDHSAGDEKSTEE